MPDAGVVLAASLPRDLPYPPESAADRETLLTFAREASLTYGTWDRFKALYKVAEADVVSTGSDSALLGTLLARMDDAPITLGDRNPRVNWGIREYANSLAVRGDYLFLAYGYNWNEKTLGVYTRNPANPLKPLRVATLAMPGTFGALITATRRGSLLCLFMNSSSDGVLQLVDISDPARPRLRGKLALGKPTMPAISDADAASYLLYAETPGQSGTALRVIDLRDPDALTLAGGMVFKSPTSAYRSASPGNVATGGNLAVVTVTPAGSASNRLPQSGGVRILDISDSTKLRQVGGLDLPYPVCVVMRGQFVYAGIVSANADESGVQVVDLSDPWNPRRAGFAALGKIVGMVLPPDGRYLYAWDQNGALHILDIQDPAAPVLIASGGAFQGTTEMHIAGDVAYILSPYSGVAILSLAVPQTPTRVGAPPSGDTIGYMKRRGRRVLRKLAKSDAPRYAEVATEMLLAVKAGTLDPAQHWATIDTLFGGGQRLLQTRHGRGRYIPGPKPPPKLALRTREERFPDAWNARPDLLARLLTAPGTTLPVQAFAARVLRTNRQPLPPIADAVLAAWVASAEPLLIALAVRLIAARLLAGESVTNTLAADVFYRANASVRGALAREQAPRWATKQGWALEFALRLAELIKPADSARLAMSRRQTDSAMLLARYFSWAIAPRPDTLLPLVAPFLASGRAELESVIVVGAGRAAPENLLAWLTQLSRLGDVARSEPVLAALGTAMRSVALDRQAARQLVYHSDAFVRLGGWRMLAASVTGGDVLKPLWDELLASPVVTDALTSAMGSADALGLLERAGIGAPELAAHVASRPFLVGLLSPEAFVSVAASAPASVVLALIAASPDEHYRLLRPVWLRQLSSGVGTREIWLAAESAVADDATNRLEARLLGDPEVAETLLLVDDERVLAIRAPEFGALLGAWVTHHMARLTRDSSLLYEGATHPLPEVRTPSLVRVTELGMSMPFALRLLESALPPSMAVGKSFFDAEPTGGERETDYALALCDSPFADVRALGIAYVTDRAATLPRERVLSALFENPAPEMQAFVAAQLGDAVRPGENSAPRPETTPRFDAEVLRATNRARVAKERIKARQTGEGSLDVATLLTLARARTPRDAEWALGELARRVSRGEVIEGVVLEGVVGV